MTWPHVKLSDVADVVRGVTFSKADVGSERSDTIPILRAGNIQDVLILDEDLVYLSPNFVSEKQILQSGDIVMCMSSGSANVLGKSALLKTTWRGSFGAFLAVVRARPEKVDANYLAHYFREPAFRKWASSSNGIGIKNIRLSDLAAYEIPLPLLEEQKRIAEILDQADALRRLRARALEKLNTLGQAVFQEMFGDPQRNPKNWLTRPLQERGKLDRGVSKHRPRNDPALLGGSYPLIQTGDVSKADDYITVYRSTYSELGLRQSRIWPKGTVCITIAANIADTAILDFDACFPDSVVGFDSENPALNFFIHRWFETIKGHLDAIAPSVAQKNINLSILRDLPVICPPGELVAQFYKREAAVREQKTKMHDALQNSIELFNSLQSAAFQGKL